MKLSVKQLAEILRILDKMDRGDAAPNISGPVGRFLRQHRAGKEIVDTTLHEYTTKRRADGAFSGERLGSVTLMRLSELEASSLGFPLGEVADAPAVSEELGVVTYVRLWLKSPAANAAYNVLKRGTGVTFSGDYRWNPPARITTGEALIAASAGKTHWRYVRCLKGVADDLIRPPHALEYVVDYRLGPPGIKHFRIVCAIRRGPEWHVLPALGISRSLPITGTQSQILVRAKDGELVAVLVYCEPWSASWTVVDAVAVDPAFAFAHAITWVDFQRELEGLPLDTSLVDGVKETLSKIGLPKVKSTNVALERQLLPVARDLLRNVRGLR